MLSPSTSSFLSTRLSEPSLKHWRCSRWDKSPTNQLSVDILFLWIIGLQDHDVNLLHIESRSSVRVPGYEFIVEVGEFVWVFLSVLSSHLPLSDWLQSWQHWGSSEDHSGPVELLPSHHQEHRGQSAGCALVPQEDPRPGQVCQSDSLLRSRAWLRPPWVYWSCLQKKKEGICWHCFLSQTVRYFVILSQK